MDKLIEAGEQEDYSTFKSVALIGNFLPRKCGIATFTTHLLEAIKQTIPATDCWAIAINDRVEGYRYPPQVRLEINQDLLKDYEVAADFLNVSNVEAVCLQHEFGIFGGQRGGFIVELLANLKIPVVTTLHTILQNPTDSERYILGQIANLSDRLVVMSDRSIEFLRDIYQVDADKIVLIPHGIPDIQLTDASSYKDRFGLSGQKVLLTFGLLSPGKGIETAIQGLPEIIKSHPDVVYLIVGSTHPHLQATEGENYRIGLHMLAKELGVEDHVQFYEHFVADDELYRYLGAADIYLTPYLNEEQIISGALSYALGMGKAVVSTPYWHAQELLAEGRGRLIPFRASTELAQAVIDLLDHPHKLQELRHKAYAYCRKMTWSNVGRQYVEAFEQARKKPMKKHSPAGFPPIPGQGRIPLPEIKLDHLTRMTDGVGILQHSKYTVPDREHGYCVDDNARALIVMATLQNLRPKDASLTEYISVYLSFLEHAFSISNGAFRNFMSYDRRWMEVSGSEDSQGRALWGLGVTVALGSNRGQIEHARDLFQRALPASEGFTSLRAFAFSIIGIDAFLSRHGANKEAESMCRLLSERMMREFRNCAGEKWPWFEDILTYDNARLPQALLISGRLQDDEEMLKTGLRSLVWLKNIQQDESGRYFTPVGNHGWLRRGFEKPRFDQQPIEAAAMIAASIEAFKTTGDYQWTDIAYRCLNWYLGENDLRLPLYDHATGGCRDGLQAQSLNENQGAESVSCWLMSLLDIYWHKGQDEIKKVRNENAKPLLTGRVYSA
ncbi:MAG: glycosyltransferase family 4 protein [Gammaproteobacteria bacterium]|nr:glycosyltransferase family 4 protein [Gammaproteobacteria bacterium]